MNRLHTLVTGVGGVTGQGILQCLLRLKPKPFIVGTDISPRATGLFWTDAGFVLPPCYKLTRYLATIRNLCDRFDIDVVFPGSDREARVLTNQAWFDRRRILVATARKDVWNITGDKLMISKLALSLGIASPATLPYSKKAVELISSEFGFPIVVKPRKSSGSRGIIYVDGNSRTPDQTLKGYVAQPYLPNDGNEYTVGTYIRHNNVGSAPVALVAMRRWLSNGNTATAEIVTPALFEEAIGKISHRLSLSGYCNFQFIVYKGQPNLIDINARFSSSVSIGLHIGCNFVDYYLRDNFGRNPVPSFRSSEGKTVVRYFADCLLDSKKLEEVKQVGV